MLNNHQEQDSKQNLRLDKHAERASAKQSDVADEVLIARIVKEQDQKAHAILLQRYINKMWRLAISILKNEQEAEDAVQDVFVSLLQSLENWDPNGQAKFSTWIYRVTFNKCIDIKRKKKPNESADNIDLASEEKTAYQITLSNQLSEKLIEIVKTLPDGQSDALRLYYFKEMSVEEISGQLDKSEQSIRSLIKRGKAGLKDKIQLDPAFQSLDMQGLAKQLW